MIPLIIQLAVFAGTAALVIVTPGPDTAVTLGSTLSRGRAASVSTAFGVLCGEAVWTLASSAGLSALLQASEPVFAAVKYAGAAYLAFLGLQALRAALRKDAHELSGLAADRLPERRDRLACFRRALLSERVRSAAAQGPVRGGEPFDGCHTLDGRRASPQGSSIRIPQPPAPRRRSTTVLMPPLRTAVPSGRWPRKSHRLWTNARASPSSGRTVCAGRGKEFGGGERIEVEHLSPGELSVANLVQA